MRGFALSADVILQKPPVALRSRSRVSASGLLAHSRLTPLPPSTSLIARPAVLSRRKTDASLYAGYPHAQPTPEYLYVLDRRTRSGLLQGFPGVKRAFVDGVDPSFWAVDPFFWAKVHPRFFDGALDAKWRVARRIAIGHRPDHEHSIAQTLSVAMTPQT